MSQITLHCPQCQTSLLIPRNAAGRRARCGNCENRFILPSAQEMLDFEIAEMATQELGQRWRQDKAAMAAKTAKSKAETKITSKTPAETKKETVAAGLPSRPASQPPSRPVAQPISSNEDSTGDTAMGIPVPDAALSKTPRQPQSVEAAPTYSVAAAQSHPSTAAYPSNLCRPPARPYLIVRDVENHGVHLAFDARWLHNENFLVSMPARCAFTGETKELTARVFVAKNRTRHISDRPRAIEMHYEQTVDHKHDPRKLVRAIARIDGLREPFDLPLLYYACEGHTNNAIECWGTRATDGSDLVEIRLPHAELAREWVAQVNGTCGPEYHRLRQDIDDLGSSAWLALPERTRQRIEAWCKLERGEHFKLFLREFDLTCADEGLGGIVITDRQLRYHKYRQSKSLSFDKKATLHIVTDDRCAHLTLESGGRLIRTGKISRGDVSALVNALQEAPQLRVVMGKK